MEQWTIKLFSALNYSVVPFIDMQIHIVTTITLSPSQWLSGCLCYISCWIFEKKYCL